MDDPSDPLVQRIRWRNVAVAAVLLAALALVALWPRLRAPAPRPPEGLPIPVAQAPRPAPPAPPSDPPASEPENVAQPAAPAISHRSLRGAGPAATTAPERAGRSRATRRRSRGRARRGRAPRRRATPRRPTRPRRAPPSALARVSAPTPRVAAARPRHRPVPRPPARREFRSFERPGR